MNLKEPATWPGAPLSLASKRRPVSTPRTHELTAGLSVPEAVV